MEHQAYRFFRCASTGAGYSGDAYAQRRLAAVADALGESGCNFAADGAVAIDHFCRNAGEFGFQHVGVDDCAAKKISRTSADRGDALGQQASGAGFGDGQRGVAHLQPVADDLLERFAVAGIDGVVEFIFDEAGDFVDAALGCVESGGARFEVKFDFSGAGEDGGVDVGVALVNRSDAGVDLRTRPASRSSRSGLPATREELWHAGARALRIRREPSVRDGGPGSRTMMCSRPSNCPLSHWPGAVPLGFGRTVAPSSTSACFVLLGDIFHPRSAKRCSRRARISGSRRRVTPSASATASRVRSSSVGPRPPMKMRMSERKRPCCSGFDQATQIIADDALENYVNAQQVELLGEVERVGVHAEGREHLGAHRDDFGIHV